MSSFLQLCQDVARESGTISGTQPTSVSSQTGRLRKVVQWTNKAWEDIQNSRPDWRWMQGELEDGEITASTARYTSASFSLTRWADWIVDLETHDSDQIWTIYKQSVGVSDERPLRWIDWLTWRRRYGRGEQEENYPVEYTVSPAGEICFGPIPDTTYLVSGLYHKSPQALSADGDTPEMPSRFHRLIVYKALILLAEHDEAEVQIATANRGARELMAALERDQLPPVRFGEALA